MHTTILAFSDVLYSMLPCSSQKKKKILIMTATGKSNLGDELILREEIRFIRSRYVNTEITVATYNQDTHLIENPD